MTTRLKIGDVLKLTGGLFRVTRVSDCSATIIHKEPVIRRFTDRRTGKPVVIKTRGPAVIIATRDDAPVFGAFHPVEKNRS